MSTLRRRKAAGPAQWPLDGAITVVLFAGLGGACAGLEEAGCPVQVANNHDAVALAAHAALHPHTQHVRGDIFDVDPLKATSGRRVKVLWASPDCKDHSVAKGGAPRSARVRSLPWQVCRWAGKTQAEVIFIENVREIRGWGPLVAKRCKITGRVIRMDGTVAAKGERVPLREQQLVRDRSRLGLSFRRFTRHLQGLGYDYEDRDLNCADFGVPTARRRYWAVARRDGLPIGWPAPTHAPANVAGSLGLLPHVAAANILDWSIPIPSIFERRKELVKATHKRLATGLYRFVLTNPRPYMIPLASSDRRHTAASYLTMFNENSTGQSPQETIKTIMAGAPRFGVCAAALVQTGYGEAPGQAPRALDIERPIGTQVAGGGKHAVVGAFLAEHRGNSVGQLVDKALGAQTQVPHHAVVAAWMAQHNTGLVGHPMEHPVSTLTAGVAQQQVAVGYLAHLRGSTADHPGCRPLDVPAPTLTAGGGHVAAVAAFMTQYYTGGSPAQSVNDPLSTTTTHMRHGVVGVTIQGTPYVVADIGMRMLEPHEAAAAHELVLPARITIDGKSRPLTKTESMRLIGNSVPKRMARLLAEANIVHALSRGRVAA